MKVILAGMPKTGTKSMSAALTLLGYKTYDWMENFWWLGDDWVRIMQDGATTKDFRRMYNGVDAVTDTPCNQYWEEILTAFPDAKVILTVRDEDSWCQSRRNQNEKSQKDIFFRTMLSLTYSGWKMSSFMYHHDKYYGSRRSNWPWTNLNQYNYDDLRQIYTKHNNNVLQKCPKRKLLVFDVKQGWKPLCDFLGVEVPQEEFPRKNIGASILADYRKENTMMHRMLKEFLISLFCLSGMAAFVLYKCLIALSQK